MQPTSFQYELGSEVKCLITGFVGIVKSRSQWLTGCNTYGVMSQELKEGKPQDTLWFDEHALEATDTPPIKLNYPATVEVIEAAEPARLPARTGGPSIPIGSSRSHQVK